MKKERGLLLAKPLRAKSRVDEKTQTRRTQGLEYVNDKEYDFEFHGFSNEEDALYAEFHATSTDDGGNFKSQWRKGDHLYLQEPYRILNTPHSDKAIVHGYYADDNIVFDVELLPSEADLWISRKFPYRKTSSRFMYRSLARTWFEVTGVRMEMLQDISEADAIAEGVERTGGGRYWIAAFDQGFTPRATAREAFFDLWDSCNKIKAKQNPWVFPYTFKRIEK